MCRPVHPYGFNTNQVGAVYEQWGGGRGKRNEHFDVIDIASIWVDLASIYIDLASI